MEESMAVDAGALKPGRELDALVAEKVMGLHVKRVGSGWFQVADAGTLAGSPYVLEDGREAHVIKNYSTDIAAAWQVIEKMRRDGWHYEVTAHFTNDTNCAEFGRGYYDKYEHYWSDSHQECAPTAAHAICLAALRAVGVKIPG